MEGVYVYIYTLYCPSMLRLATTTSYLATLGSKERKMST
jgi:hypothetical protein